METKDKGVASILSISQDKKTSAIDQKSSVNLHPSQNYDGTSAIELNSSIDLQPSQNFPQTDKETSAIDLKSSDDRDRQPSAASHVASGGLNDQKTERKKSRCKINLKHSRKIIGVYVGVQAAVLIALASVLFSYTHKLSNLKTEMEKMKQMGKQEVKVLTSNKKAKHRLKRSDTQDALDTLNAQQLVIDDIKDRLTDQLLDTMALYQKINDVTDDISNLKPKVAFAAFNERPGQNTFQISGNAYMQFSGVLTSVGGGYDPARGVFTAPVAGLYLMDVRVQCGGAHIKLRLVCGDQTAMVINTHCANTWALEGKTAPVKLAAGAECGVRAWAGVASTAFSSMSQDSGNVGSSTFSGHLIHEA